jgi:hypothetical protein
MDDASPTVPLARCRRSGISPGLAIMMTTITHTRREGLDQPVPPGQRPHMGKPETLVISGFLLQLEVCTYCSQICVCLYRFRL